MPSTQKIERVAELRQRIEGSAALLLTEYRGLSVSEITELRASLREGGARFSVIKNTLMRRALETTDAAGLGSLFDGPSAVAFVVDDPVAAAKSVTAAAKKFPSLVLKSGFVEGRVLSADEAKALADLDSREVMLSRLAGMMKSEMSRVAAAFQAVQSRFLSVLDAYTAKLPHEPSVDVSTTPSDGVASVPGAGEETSGEQTAGEQTPGEQTPGEQTPGEAEAAAPVDEHEGAELPESPGEQSTDEEG